MKSVGDFALNIIPKLDSKSLKEGLSTLGTLNQTIELGKKVVGLFADVFGDVADQAKRINDLFNWSKALKIPVQQFDMLGKSMQQFGMDGEEAVGVFNSLKKLVGGFKWGEIGASLLREGKMSPAQFGNDVIKNLNMVRDRVIKLNSRDAQKVLGEMGLGNMFTMMMSKDWYGFQQRASKGLVTDKMVAEAVKLQTSRQQLGLTKTEAMQQISEEAYSSFADMIKEFNNLLSDKEAIAGFANLIGGLAQLASLGAQGLVGIGEGLNWVTGKIESATGAGYQLLHPIIKSKRNPIEESNTETSNVTNININAGTIVDPNHLGTIVEGTIKKVDKAKASQKINVDNASAGSGL